MILISFTFFPDLIHLAAYGKVYSIPEGEESSAVTPLNYLSEVLLDVLDLAEGLRMQKIHETKHLSYEFAGTFTMEQDILHKMHVTLSVDDENKVEFFEVTNPSTLEEVGQCPNANQIQVDLHMENATEWKQH